MESHFRTAASLLIALACSSAMLNEARAQTYPSGRILLIVPAAAGGVTDLVARITADYLAARTKQQVVVENRTGAGGNLATAAVAKAEPDGYTLGVVASGNIVINPYLYKTMPFDAKNDVIPVAAIAEAPQVIAIHKDIPAKNLQEFIALAKAKPNTINYGSAGVGTSMHLAGDQFARLAGVQLTHVPYRGAAPAVTDLIAGNIQMISVSAGPIMGFVRSGDLRVLAAASQKPLKHFPDVPTSSAAGLKGYEMTTWFALFAPRGTPPEVVKTLHGLVQDMLNDPTSKKRLEENFLDLMPASQADFASFVTSEFSTWERIVRDAGLQPQ
ncbi:MAG: extra-cytoplasmic solute receptor protein [Xanthobacteraceae bacterium]|jgi:tripartite-type tricarboxylate transporter receptor subunit TctC|nr:extra-cytoplasmic solute receptor protein [Xanthobacteraceae bacterium]